MPTALTRRIVALVAALLVMCVPSVALASVMPMSIGQLCAAADKVALVTVEAESVRARGEGEGRVPMDDVVTVSDLRVRETYKGVPADHVRVSQPGGSANGFTLVASDVPDLAPGQTAVVFLDEAGIVGGRQGYLVVEDGRIPSLGISLVALERQLVSTTASSAPTASSDDGAQAPAPRLAESATQGASALAGMSIFSVTPPTGANSGTGEALTITGSGFGTSPGSVWLMRGTSMSLGSWYDRTQATVVSWTPTNVVVTVPAGVQPGELLVRDSSGAQTAATRYEVGFSFLGVRWPTARISYRINGNTADTTGEVDAIRRAMDTWNRCGSNFSMDYAGASSMEVEQQQTNGANDIFFTSGLPAGYLAMNKLWFNDSTHQFVESDLMFDDRYAWGHGSSTSYWDIETVALHELGHTVGLGDQYASQDRVMGAGQTGIVRRELTPVEVNGAMFAYGSSLNARIKLGSSAKLKPSFGKPAYVSVRLYDRWGGALPDRAVTLLNPAGSQVATLTGSVSDPGLYYGYAPVVSKATRFSATFAGDGVSGPVALSIPVTPKARLTANAPERNRAYRSFRVKGTIAPAHGKAKVTFQIQKRRKSGSYYTYKRYSITTSKAAFSRSMKLPRGTYRVRTTHSDASHASSASTYDTFKVR